MRLTHGVHRSGPLENRHLPAAAAMDDEEQVNHGQNAASAVNICEHQIAVKWRTIHPNVVSKTLTPFPDQHVT